MDPPLSHIDAFGNFTMSEYVGAMTLRLSQRVVPGTIYPQSNLTGIWRAYAFGGGNLLRGEHSTVTIAADGTASRTNIVATEGGSLPDEPNAFKVLLSSDGFMTFMTVQGDTDPSWQLAARRPARSHALGGRPAPRTDPPLGTRPGGATPAARLIGTPVAAAVANGLRIQLLGPLRVFRDGEPLPLPASRKTRALLSYLVLSAREHGRDRLCALLWPEVDDPRGALRWSISRLRPFVCEDGRARLVASRDTVRFDGADVHVDALDVRRLLSRDLAQVETAALAAAATAFEGPLLEGLDLPETPDFHAWCIGERERFRKLELRIVDELVERLRSDPEAAVPYAHRRVQLDRHDESAHARLIEVLGAAGRHREADQHFRGHRRWLEGHGGRPGPELVRAWAALPSADASPRLGREPEGPPVQEVRFCTASDGTKIAYATSGSGPPLVKAANWLTHLEHEWKSPMWRHWMRELSREHRLIRYDERANGLSDWNAEDLSFDALVDDLSTVVGAAGVERYALLGISQGCAIAIGHAVRHPERVSRLVLYGGFAQGWRRRGSPQAIEAREAMFTLARLGWGRRHAAFRQLFTSLFCPDATLEQRQAFDDMQRESASPENAVRLGHAFGDIDVTSLLPRVRVPTLVLHARDDAVIPFAQGRHLAASIRGARFVPLEGRNHILLEHEPAWARFLEEIRAFLSVRAGSEPPGPPAAAPV
jgi:DNA-binding SARP family transcriptional activator/pimeloyl-ACP methyl ester carboxylesterase